MYPSTLHPSPLIQQWHANDVQADPEYLQLFAKMDLKELDIFLHLPTSANDYASAQISVPNTMGEMSFPPLSVQSSQQSAIEIMEEISRKQERPLARLTLHLSRTGYGDRMESCLMMAMIQVRRGANGGYEFSGKTEWSGMGSLKEEMGLEDD
jgi:hypothetical protein